jgi:allantoin racemase
MKILLVNPNLTAAITAMMAEVARNAASPGTEIIPITGEFGAQVIGSRAESAIAQHGIMDLVAKHHQGCDAVVLGVSLDTALFALREVLAIPVVGLTEAGLLSACMTASRFGLITLGGRMIPVYQEMIRAYGLESRAVAVGAIENSPLQATTDPDAVRKSVAAACLKMVEEERVESIVLAGAALAGFSTSLRETCPVPLIDCMACALPLAEMLARLRLRKPVVGSLAHPGERVVKGVSAELAALLGPR